MITPTSPLASGPFPAVLGVYRRLSLVVERSAGRVKAEIGENRPLKDVNGEHLELRAGSGFRSANPIDVGVRDGAKNGVDLEKSPKMAGCAGALRAGWARSGPRRSAPLRPLLPQGGVLRGY